MKSIALISTLFLVSSFGHTVAQEPSIKQKVMDIAANSQCSKVDWKDRGPTPKAFLRGTALVYAKALCRPGRAYVKIASKGVGDNPALLEDADSVAWYDAKFKALGLPKSEQGRAALRNTFTLMIGLAQRESSGQHCVGRDMSADFVTHDSAEAGIYQTSWGVRRANPTLLEAMTKGYAEDKRDCLLDVFSAGVSCPAKDAKNWGAGPGVAWQELTKKCPAFATEYAAVIVRQSGGKKGEFGPIRKRQSELAPSCDAMLKDVEQLVLAKPENCSGF
jgi:hypothetical protein